MARRSESDLIEFTEETDGTRDTLRHRHLFCPVQCLSLLLGCSLPCFKRITTCFNPAANPFSSMNRQRWNISGCLLYDTLFSQVLWNTCVVGLSVVVINAHHRRSRRLQSGALERALGRELGSAFS